MWSCNIKFQPRCQHVFWLLSCSESTEEDEKIRNKTSISISENWRNKNFTLYYEGIQWMHDSLMWGSCVWKVQANIKRKAVIKWTDWLFTTQRVCEKEAFFFFFFFVDIFLSLENTDRVVFVTMSPSGHRTPPHTLCVFFMSTRGPLFFFLPLITLTASPSIYTLCYSFKPAPTPVWWSTIKSAGLSPWNVTEGRYHRANVRYITHI